MPYAIDLAEWADNQWFGVAYHAGGLGVTVEDLARAGVLDIVRRPDKAFDQIANRMLEKNADLYGRLG